MCVKREFDARSENGSRSRLGLSDLNSTSFYIHHSGESKMMVNFHGQASEDLSEATAVRRK